LTAAKNNAQADLAAPGEPLLTTGRVYQATPLADDFNLESGRGRA